jgi:hypothetical protein
VFNIENKVEAKIGSHYKVESAMESLNAPVNYSAQPISFLQRHSQIFCASYYHWTGLPLVAKDLSPQIQAEALMDAPFGLVSHDAQDDPVFNYGNTLALQLFGYTWDEFTQLSSRYSAEPMNRIARAALLARVTQHGFVDDYSGVRIAKDGTRFLIKNAIVWNLLDEMGAHYGQAALIRNWSSVYPSLLNLSLLTKIGR